jgi:plasmid stability protein
MLIPSRLCLLVCGVALLSACAGLSGTAGADHAASAVPPAPPPPVLTPYLETLGNMGPGDAARQQAELDATLAAAQQTRSSADTLRYALALGAAGHPSSNPVEARRLITELLASPNTLDPTETAFATAYLREFDARVALYAELARQREESEQKLKSLDATAVRRADALAAENKQLKRALAEAESKLEAVAEMERSLLEQAGAEAEQPPRP